MDLHVAKCGRFSVRRLSSSHYVLTLPQCSVPEHSSSCGMSHCRRAELALQ